MSINTTGNKVFLCAVSLIYTVDIECSEVLSNESVQALYYINLFVGVPP